MSAEAEWGAMCAVWRRRCLGSGVRVGVFVASSSQLGERFAGPVPHGLFHAYLQVAAPGKPFSTVLSGPAVTHDRDEAYKDLLASYRAGGHLRCLPPRLSRLFPPCGSAAELELRLAVTEASE